MYATLLRRTQLYVTTGMVSSTEPVSQPTLMDQPADDRFVRSALVKCSRCGAYYKIGEMQPQHAQQHKAQHRADIKHTAINLTVIFAVLMAMWGGVVWLNHGHSLIVPILVTVFAVIIIASGLHDIFTIHRCEIKYCIISVSDAPAGACAHTYRVRPTAE